MKIHLPYFSEKSSIAVRNEIVEVKAYQIIVWVSIAIGKTSPWDPRTFRFPAILDTGTTRNFAVTQAHLLKWAGVHLASLRDVGKIRIDARDAGLHSVGLWLHTENEPFQLHVEGGIAVLNGDWPRLPILGLRALTNSKLQTFIYGDTKQLVIRTPPKWYWPF